MLASQAPRANQWKVWGKGLGAIAVLYAVLVYGARIEAEFFPIAGEFVLTNKGVSSQGYPTFQVHSVRYRPECSFSYVFWYGLTDDGETMLAGRRSYGQLGSFPAGANLSSLIEVAVSPDAPKMYAEARYWCFGEPWLSRVTIGPFDNWTYRGGKPAAD